MHLVLNSYGNALYVKDRTFVVQAAAGRDQLAPDRIKSISISRGTRVSSDAVLLAIEHEIDLLFIDGKGQRPDLVLLFVSPSGNGLKLLFRLAEPYRDPNLYRLFYQAFIQRLAADHGLESVIDTRTHDVSRVCFFSYDPRAWFAPDARAVDGSAYADPADPDLEHRLAAGRAELRDQQPDERDDATAAGGPDDATLLAIKQRLNPRYRPPRPRNAHAPAKIEALLPDLEAYLAANDLRLVPAESIQHRKTFAEINEALAEVQAAYDNEDSILLIPVQAATVGSMKIIGKDIQIQSLVDPPNTLFY